MTVFVLQHGSWLGGWCWDAVALRLRQAGHRVLTPTIEGCAERAHRATEVTLARAVDELIAVLQFEGRAVLVAHSFGGLLAEAAAARAPDHIERLDMLDAVLPRHGRSIADIYPPARVAQANADAAASGTVPPISIEELAPDLTAQTRIAVSTRLRPMPMSLLTMPVDLSGASDIVPRRYGYCDWTLSTIAQFAGQAALLGPVKRFSSGHLPMLSVPDEVAAWLLNATPPT